MLALALLGAVVPFFLTGVISADSSIDLLLPWIWREKNRRRRDFLPGVAVEARVALERRLGRAARALVGEAVSDWKVAGVGGVPAGALASAAATVAMMSMCSSE